MSKLRDLTGQRFGKLVVISQAENITYGKKPRSVPAWLCKCDCGKETIMMTSNIIRDSTKGCGCSRGIDKRKDIAGQRFGKLIAVKPTEKRRAKNIFWECQCDCGGTKLVTVADLECGKVKSCGCFRDGSENTFVAENDILSIYSSSGERIGICDLSDYDIVNKYTWNNLGNGYLTAAIRADDTFDSKRIGIGRLLLNPKNDEFVDHINGDPSDNRRVNLRVCTPSQNSMNKKIPLDNTSGVKGVCWHIRKKKWSAYISINKKQRVIGLFDNIEDAKQARLQAEMKHYGEFARLNENVEGGF